MAGRSTAAAGVSSAPDWGSRRGKADLDQIRASDARTSHVGKLRGKAMKQERQRARGGQAGREAAASTAEAAARHAQGEGSTAATEPAEKAKAATAAGAKQRRRRREEPHCCEKIRASDARAGNVRATAAAGTSSAPD